MFKYNKSAQDTNLIDTIDKILCVTFVAILVLSGGKPISPIVYGALEKIYNIDLPTYSIPELLDIIDDKNRQMAMALDISKMKLEVDSYQKLLDILKSKDIQYIQVVGYQQGIAQLKIEGNINVQKIKQLISNIKITSNFKISVDYLNEEELVLTVQKGVPIGNGK